MQKMKTIDFECLKCGTCCKNLLEDFDGLLKGLVLTGKETKLFPEETISPQMAIGVDSPKIILQYQMNANDCPHLTEKNECKIYNNRPLMCKAFPYESGTVSNKCKLFVNVKIGEPVDTEISNSEMEASEKLNRHTMNLFQKEFRRGMKLWEYDLATKKWFLKRPRY
jgi:Fe-S-cluster containining protein